MPQCKMLGMGRKQGPPVLSGAAAAAHAPAQGCAHSGAWLATAPLPTVAHTDKAQAGRGPSGAQRMAV